MIDRRDKGSTARKSDVFMRSSMKLKMKKIKNKLRNNQPDFRRKLAMKKTTLTTTRPTTSKKTTLKMKKSTFTTTPPTSLKTTIRSPQTTIKNKLTNVEQLTNKSTSNFNSVTQDKFNPRSLPTLLVPPEINSTNVNTDSLNTTNNIQVTSDRESNSFPLQMLPGMVARGSGPRFGFGFTNRENRAQRRFDERKLLDTNALLLEISRQLVLPKIRNSQRINIGSDDSEEISTESPVEQSPAPTASINPRSSHGTFKFPRLRNSLSFSLQPALFSRNTTLRPIVMSGPRQEDITELKAKRNGLTLNPLLSSRHSTSRNFTHSNQAFFIPDTHLTPPTNIGLPKALIRENDRESIHDRLQENKIQHLNEVDNENKKMTMKFPEALKIERLSNLNELFRNPKCPECHPGFLTPGRCSPCVKIR